MKNYMEKVEAASKITDLKGATRKQRRFVAAVTRKIVDKKVVEAVSETIGAGSVEC